MGAVSGCASRSGVAAYSHPGSEDDSIPVASLPYRVDGHVYYPLRDSSGFSQEGTASWYGRDFHGKPTSSGEVYDMYSVTAAHKTLPFNTRVQVTHQENGKSIIVRINDRGPFVGGRVIDLSYGAARKLGIIEQGTAPVTLRVLREKSSALRRRAATRPTRQGNFAVQVGVFANPSNARMVSRRFPHSRIQPVQQNDRKIYKVLVGNFSNYETALGHMDQIRLRGFDRAFIVLSP